MLFRRREPQGFWTRVRTALWPRRSWSRSLTYLKKRVLRLNATPHAIAAGFAAGVAASFTPLIGFHFLLAFALAYVVAGNMAAAAFGTAIGNPLTFPAIWKVTYELGRRILDSGQTHVEAPPGLGLALMHLDFSAIWTPLLKPMLVGALPLGLVSGALSYALVYAAARTFQAHRLKRLAARRQAASKTPGGDLAGDGEAAL